MTESGEESNLFVDAIERLSNALLEESTAARELLAALENKRLGIHLAGLEIETVVRSDGRAVHLERAPAASADVAVSGTPIALLQAWRAGSTASFAAHGVRLSGDVRILEDFVRLYELAAPDLEEVLARLTGDVIARAACRVAGSVRAWTGHALEALVLNAGEYLQEERRDLPARQEAAGFYGDIETLRDDVERAAVRIERLAGRGDGPLAPEGD